MIHMEMMVELLSLKEYQLGKKLRDINNEFRYFKRKIWWKTNNFSV
jgi:hypothetical protein